jgi:adenylate cyclase
VAVIEADAANFGAQAVRGGRLGRVDEDPAGWTAFGRARQTSRACGAPVCRGQAVTRAARQWAERRRRWHGPWAKAMSRNEIEAAIVLADVTGSMPLFEELGDAEAMRRIVGCLGTMRAIIPKNGGILIREKGDDVLCIFAEPASALQAVRTFLSQQSGERLAVHAGIHFGPLIRTRGSIFGDAVNVTARLASLANPGEVLMSESFVDRLPEKEKRSLRVLNDILFKGKSDPTKVYTILEEDTTLRTEITWGNGSERWTIRQKQGHSQARVTLHYGGHSFVCEEGTSVSIGRSNECDVVVERPWVSRRHVTVTARQGKVQLIDVSSYGTYVSTGNDDLVLLHRETMLLTRAGIISPTFQPTDRASEVIHYDVVALSGDPHP